MFCEKCGKQIQENVRFCANCGQMVNGIKSEVQSEPQRENIVEVNVSKNQQKKQATKLNWKKVMLVTVVLIFLLIGIGAYLYFTSSFYAIQKGLNKDNVSEVVEQYNGEVYGDKLAETATDTLVVEYIQTLIGEYNSKEKDYDVVCQLLSVLTGLKNKELSNAAGDALITIQSCQKNEIAYQRAEELYENGNYADAINQYKLVTKDSDLYEPAQKRIKDSQTKYKENILSQVNTPTTLEEYKQCLKLLKEAVGVLTDDVELAGKMQEYESAYISNVIAEADELAEQKNYEEAISILESAKKEIGTSSDIDTKIAEIESIRPVTHKLSEMNTINVNDRYGEAQNSVDTLGNSYSGGNVIELHTYGESIWGEYGYSDNRCAFAEYKLNYGYAKMTGVIAVSDLTTNEEVGARLEFLGDNKILEVYDVNRKTTPIQFELDLSDVDVLKINLVYRSADGYGDVYVLIADGQLTTNPNLHQNNVDSNITPLTGIKMTNNNDRVSVIDDHTRNDLLGNIYAPANLMEFSTYGESIWGNNGYTEDRTAFAEYYLGKEYTNLNGIVTVSDKTIDDLGARVIILGDDVELAHYDITKKTEPIMVDVNLTGVSWLRVELQFNTEDGAGDFYVLLSDFELHK